MCMQDMQDAIVSTDHWDMKIENVQESYVVDSDYDFFKTYDWRMSKTLKTVEMLFETRNFFCVCLQKSILYLSAQKHKK